MADQYAESVVLWTGGAYFEREGIEVQATKTGIVVSAWYDGGPRLEGSGLLTWELIDLLRRQSDGSVYVP